MENRKLKIENSQIIHAPTLDSPFLVVFKPAGLPSAPLFEGNESILTEAIKLFPEIALVHGKKEVEHGLVHRIDTETSGLVLIATTQESYDNLILSQKEGKFEKWYRAEVDRNPDCADFLGGFPPLPESVRVEGKKAFSVQSSFRPFGKGGREVRPVALGSGRAALKKGGSTLYTTEISFDSENTAICHISAGYRHQVRCHLAWCGLPVRGDKTYNPNCTGGNSENEAHEMKFTACKIKFPHPLTAEVQIFELPDLRM